MAGFYESIGRTALLFALLLPAGLLSSCSAGQTSGASAASRPNANQLRWVGAWGGASLAMAGKVRDVGFAAKAPAGYAVSHESGSVRVFEMPSLRTLTYLETRGVDHPSASLAANGEVVAVTLLDPEPPHDLAVALVSTKDGRKLARLFPSEPPVRKRTVLLEGRRVDIPRMTWSAVALSPEGDRLLAGDRTYGLYCFRTSDQKVLWHLEQLPGRGVANSIVWLPDGKRALVFEGNAVDGTPNLLDADTGRTLARFAPKSHDGAVAWDGRTILGFGRAQLTAWTVAPPVAIRSVAVGEEPDIVASALSSDSTRAFVSGATRIIREVTLDSAKVARTFEGHLGTVLSLASSADGRYLLSGAEDRSVKVWALATGQEIGPKGMSAAVLALTLSGDGQKVLAASADERGYAFGLDGAVSETGAAGAGGPSSPVLAAAVSTTEGGRVFRVKDTSVECRDLAGKELWRHPIQGAMPAGVELSSQGLLALATGTKLSLLDARSGVERWSAQRGWLSALAFSPDGSALAWSDQGGALELLSSADGRVMKKLPGHRGLAFNGARNEDGEEVLSEAALGALSLAFSPDGRTLASVADRELVLWSLQAGQSVFRVERDHASRATLKFSPSGSFVVVADDRGRVTAVHVATGAVSELSLKDAPASVQEASVSALLFLPDPQRLLVGTRGGSLFELGIVDAAPR